MSDTPAPTKTAAEAIAPVIEEASALGLDFRPITGLVAKRAKRLGIDLDELGQAADSALDDDAYHDQIMQAAWLLCAPESEIAAAIEGEREIAAAERWQAAALETLVHERAVYRAFMARWLEYRVELDRLFGEPAAAPTSESVA